MRLPFSFLQGGVSPFRTLLNTARPEIPKPIQSPSTGFSPEPRTPPITGATPALTDDFSSGSSLSANYSFTRSTTRTYIDNTGTRQTAAINTPRFHCRWDGAAWSQVGVLLENTATNLVLNSDDLTNGTWFKNAVTATKPGTTGADNSTAMVQLVGNGANSTHNCYRNTGSSGITSGQPFYCGWDIKKGNYNYIFGCANASGVTGGWLGFTIDLSTNQLTEILHGTGAVFDISPVVTVLRNGIVRVEFVGHINGTITTINTPIAFVGAASGNTHDANNGDSFCTIQTTDTVLIGGVMHAVSTELLQHIVTGASAVTAASDVWELTGGFGTLATSGFSVAIEAEATYSQSGVEYIDGRSAGGGAGVVELVVDAATQWRADAVSGGFSSSSPQLPGGTPFRWVASFDTGRAAASINEQVAQSAVPSSVIAPDAFYIGSFEGGGSWATTVIRSLAIYGQTLDDSQLVYLSSVGGDYTIVSAGTNAALAATETPDVAAFAADISVNAALAATEALDVAAIVATVGDNAALAATEAQDVAAFVVTETDTAVLAATEAQDVAAFVVTPKINAALAVTEAQDVAAFVIGNSAVLAATEAQDVAAFVVIETDTAVLAATEAQDVAAFAITIPDNAALAATEAQDVSAFVVTITDQAALAATEAQDVALINVTESDLAVLTATEAQDVAAFVASPKINAALAATEAPDTAAIVATVGDNAALAATEAQDVALINASGADVAVLAATEAQDTAAIAVSIIDNTALAANEAQDVAAIAASVSINVALATSEAPDIAAILADVSNAILINATEAPDTASIIVSNPVVLLAALAATETPDIAAIAASMGEVSHIDPGLPTNRFIWPRQPERWLM